MRSTIPALSALLAAAVLGACGSTDPGSGGGGVRSADVTADAADVDAKPVAGNVMVTIRTWNRNPDAPAQEPVTAGLVNATSEAGRSLASGRRSSTVYRVLDDRQMGLLLGLLEKEGFDAHAREGLDLKNLPADDRRRGVIVVEENGRARGLDYVPGGPGADAFRACKSWIFKAHQSVTGIEARVSTQAEDPNRVFQQPRAKLQR